MNAPYASKRAVAGWILRDPLSGREVRFMKVSEEEACTLCNVSMKSVVYTFRWCFELMIACLFYTDALRL
jgi:hypothetical protein